MNHPGPLLPAAREASPHPSPRPVAARTSRAHNLDQLLLPSQDQWELESSGPAPLPIPNGLLHQTLWRHRSEPAQIMLQWQTADDLAILLREVSWQRQATPSRSAVASLRRWAEQVRAIPWELIPAWSICEVDESLQEGIWRSPCLPEADGSCYYELHCRIGHQLQVALRSYRVPAHRRREPALFTLPRPALVRLLTAVDTALRHCCG
jgi:hypothetical protein